MRWFLIGMIALFLGTLCQVIAPIFIKLAVDSVSPDGVKPNEGFATQAALAVLPEGVTSGQNFVIACMLMVGGLSLMLAVATFYKRYYLIRLSRATEYRLKNRMYDSLQNMPAVYFDKNRSGGTMSLMTSDVEACRMMIGPAVMYLGNTFVMFPAALVIMYSLNATLTLMSLVPLVGLTLATVWFNPRVRKYTVKSQEDLQELSARAQENFAGARVVKAFGREDFEADELRELGGVYLKNKLGASLNQAAFQSCIWGFSGIGILIILYFGAREVSAGRFTAGDMSAFILYNMNLYWPMIALGWVTMLFVRASASLKRVDALLLGKPDLSQIEGGLDASRIDGSIEFQSVNMSYADDLPAALSDVSFTAIPGQSIAFVGQVGSGKSTVADLIVRLRAPTGGKILIDGQPIEDWNPAQLRRNIGYVPQDSFLFSDTIGQNIGLGLDDSAEAAERIIEYTQKAEFEEEVKTLPFEYETMLGERGVNLSGGQKQRAAIARALAIKPTILVLDDCLSAVDSDTEERILNNLKAEARDITTIIIAQRISTVAHADRIYVLDDGQIIEQGTDAELREAGGLYADLSRRQQLAAELA